MGERGPWASDALALDFLRKLADPIVQSLDERVELLGFAISLQRPVLVVEFLENLTKLRHRDEVLGLQREHASERFDRVLELVLFGGKRRATVPAFGKLGRDFRELLD